MKSSEQKTIPGTFCVWRPWLFIGVFALFTGATAASASKLPDGEVELLAPERAFELSAFYKDTKTLTLEYKIAEGYYLYRARFKFMVVPTASYKLGAAQFPKGKRKLDPTFGWVEAYRDSVHILLPISKVGKSVNSPDAGQLRIQVTSQGCADAGVCYPRQQQYLTFQPGAFDVVLPDGAMRVGNVENRLQSKSQAPSRSISEALRKQSNP